MKILVIEDDERIIDFISSGLTAEGYNVESSNNGPDAIKRVSTGDFQLILLDRILPGMDGASICEKLRGTGVSIPILMLTAMDALNDKIEGFRVGADDYLTKPFAFEELLVRIKALLRRQQDVYEDKSINVEYKDIKLNRETREVYRGERFIELTPKEFYLLEYFLSNPSKVVSKTMILNHIWGKNSDPITNVVEVYIRHLRKKINHEGEPVLIKTVRGFGYCLDDNRSI